MINALAKPLMSATRVLLFDWLRFHLRFSFGGKVEGNVSELNSTTQSGIDTSVDSVIPNI